MTNLLNLPFFAALPAKLATIPLLLAQAADDVPATQPEAANPVAGAIGGIIGLLIAIIMIVSMWKIFTKAGHPGWASIIPIYNLYILCKIAGKPGWFLILFLIPFVNFIAIILVFMGIAKAFGKGVGFGLGLIFLGFIFFPILAFGDARYQGSTVATF